MRIALIQIGARKDKADSLALAEEYIRRAAKEKADIAVLPEMWNCPYETKNFPVYAEEEGGPSWKRMSDAAKKHQLILVAGSMPERGPDGSIYNTCYVFDRGGRQIAKHRKMHLFDIDVKGGQNFKR